jgi:multicomponent Na+:H+ antiporter subunit D
VLLGLLSTVLGAAVALLGLRRPHTTVTERLIAPLRRLQSGHIGDYVAWTVAGMALLALLAAPGTVALR